MGTRRGNGLGSAPVKIRRAVGADTWGVRTPEHYDKEQGKKIRYWIGRDYRTKHEAQRALRDWIADFEAGQMVTRSDMLLSAWLDTWLAQHRCEGTTRAGYETKIRLHIKPHIGSIKLQAVTEDELDRLYQHLETAPCPTNAGEPLGAKTVRDVHNILSAAFRTAVERRLLPSNPASRAHPRPRARSRRSNGPTPPSTTTRPPPSSRRSGNRAGTGDAVTAGLRTTACATRRCGRSSPPPASAAAKPSA